jgi:hypothetical protein
MANRSLPANLCLTLCKFDALLEGAALSAP